MLDADHYAVDFKGHTNLLADIVPSCVGCVGLYIHEPADMRGTYDIAEYKFRGWVEQNIARPATFVGKRIAERVAA
jgi:hypothetical protein